MSEEEGRDLRITDGRTEPFHWILHETTDEMLPQIGLPAWGLYTYFVRRASGKGYCFPSIATIAQHCKSSEPTIRSLIATLVEHKLLEQRAEHVPGKKARRSYTFIVLDGHGEPPGMTPPRGGKESLPASDEGGQNALPRGQDSFGEVVKDLSPKKNVFKEETGRRVGSSKPRKNGSDFDDPAVRAKWLPGGPYYRG